MNEAEIAEVRTLVADLQAVLARETEALLAGHQSDAPLAAHKAELASRLERRFETRAGHTPERRLQAGIADLLAAAARNEAVLRGALRGVRLLVHAASDPAGYYAGRPGPSSVTANPGLPIGALDRRA